MENDILGNDFTKETLTLKNDYEGPVVATLVCKKSVPPSSKAVLYIHGFGDYFFQTEMADEFVKHGFNFYALDLRKCGRSLLSHQKNNYFIDVRESDEEIDEAIRIIRLRDNNTKMLLYGHSLGGLRSALYTQKHQNDHTIDALFLNSPFFSLARDRFTEYLLLPLISQIGKIFPNMLISKDAISQLYVKSVHKTFYGEWEFNLDWKPLSGISANAGWIRSVHYAQEQIKAGMNIACPILVMLSEKSSIHKSWNKELLETDSVLCVDKIDQYSNQLGKNLEKVKIPHAMHDLILSSKEVRLQVYDKLFQWLLPIFF